MKNKGWEIILSIITIILLVIVIIGIIRFNRKDNIVAKCLNCGYIWKKQTEEICGCDNPKIKHYVR